MGPPPVLALPRRLQRRLAVLLSMLLCLWTLAAATHFHTLQEETGTQHAAQELCGVCVSLPTGGAAPSLSTLVTNADLQFVAPPAETLPAVAAIPAASYRSRAPPVV